MCLDTKIERIGTEPSYRSRECTIPRLNREQQRVTATVGGHVGENKRREADDFKISPMA